MDKGQDRQKRNYIPSFPRSEDTPRQIFAALSADLLTAADTVTQGFWSLSDRSSGRTMFLELERVTTQLGRDRSAPHDNSARTGHLISKREKEEV